MNHQRVWIFASSIHQGAGKGIPRALSRGIVFVLGLCIFLTLVLPLNAIIWCHDYVYYRLTLKDPRPQETPAKYGIAPDELVALMEETWHYQKILISSQWTDLRPGDVIMMGKTRYHAGYVNDNSLIDHWLQPLGTFAPGMEAQWDVNGLPLNGPASGQCAVGCLFRDSTLKDFINAKTNQLKNSKTPKPAEQFFELWRPPRLTIEVTDHDTDKPIGGAEVRLDFPNPDSLQRSDFSIRQTDADGKVIFVDRHGAFASGKTPTSGQTPTVRVSHPGYLDNSPTVSTDLLKDYQNSDSVRLTPVTRTPALPTTGHFTVIGGQWTHTGIKLKKGDTFVYDSKGVMTSPIGRSWGPIGYDQIQGTLGPIYQAYNIKALIDTQLSVMHLETGSGIAEQDGELLLGVTDTGATIKPEDKSITGSFSVTVTTTPTSGTLSPPVVATAAPPGQASGTGAFNLQNAFILGVQTGFTEVVTLHNANASYLVQQVFPTMPSYAVALGLPRDNLDALIAQLSAGVASRRAYRNLAFGLGLPRSGLHALGGQRSSGVGSGQAYASVMSVRNQFYQQLNRNCSCGNVVNLAAMFQAGELMGSAEMLAFLNGDPKELAATLANAKQFAAAAGLPTDGLDGVAAHLQGGANPCDLAQELQTIEKQFEQVTNQGCTCMYEAAKDVLGTRWDETESGHHGVWSRRGNSNVFDGNIDGVTTEMTITIAGNSVNVARRKSSDGNDCNYTGTLSGDARSVKGTYVCKNGGPYNWEATITR